MNTLAARGIQPHALGAALSFIFNNSIESPEALEARLIELNDQAKHIQARAKVEGRELTADEQAKTEEIFAEFELVEAKLSMAGTPAKRKTSHDGPNARSTTQVGLTYQGGLLPANCADPYRFIFGNQVSQASQFQGSTAEFLAYCRNPANQFQNATATEGVGVDGGFAVPTTLHQEIMAELMATSELWRLCRAYPVTANNVTIALPDVLNQLANLANLQVDWKAENASANGQILKWREVDLKLGKLMAMAEASSELEEDAPGYARTVETTLGADAGMRLDHALIAGVGSGTPLGYLNAPSTIEIPPESGQAADTVLWANVVQLYSRLHPACKRRAVWLASPDVMAQLLTMQLPNGNPALLSGSVNDGGAGSPAPRLLGRPILETTLTPILGNRGDLALVDFSQVALIMRNSMRIDYSQHLNFNRDVVNWRIRWRVDAVPIWDQVFTPRNGGLSLSWATVLGARG